MQRIRLKGDHFDKVLRGAGAVIRISKKTPDLGEAVLWCENVPPYEVKVIIDRITILPWETLNPYDIGKTGFKGTGILREALESFYDIKIEPRQTVRMIEFFKDEGEEC